MPTRRRLRDWLSRDHLYISVPALILVMGAFVVAWSFMKPAPPRRLAMASGPPDGIYYQMGLRYRALLAREGITLDVRTTSGSVENVGLLEDAANPGQQMIVTAAERSPKAPDDAQRAPIQSDL